MAQNLIKTNAEAVLPNRPTIVKYVAGLEGGAELVYPESGKIPEDGVIHAGHPVAYLEDGKWQLATLNTGEKYSDFDGAEAYCGFGVVAHDIPFPEKDADGEYHTSGAIMLIGVVNTEADDRFIGYGGVLTSIKSNIAFYGGKLM